MAVSAGRTVDGMPTGARSLEGAKQRAPGNALANAAGLLVDLVLTVFITARLVRGLGAVDYGIWALIGHIAGQMNLLDFGMAVTVTRYFARHHALDERDQLEQVICSALLFSLVPATLVMGAGALAAIWAPGWFHIPAAAIHSTRVALLVIAASVGLMFPGGVLNSCLPALSRYDLLNVRRIFWSMTRVGALWWVLDHGYGLVAVAVVCLAAEVAALTLGTVLSYRQVPWLRLRWRQCTAAMLQRLFRFSFWAFLLSVASRLIFTADNIVVGLVLGPVAVAYYGIASSIGDQVRGGMATLTNLYVSLASQVHALEGREAMQRLLLRGSRLAVLALLPGVASLIVLGTPFLNFWLGPDYALRSSGILSLLCLSSVAYAVCVTCTQVLYAMNRHRLSAILALVEAAVNLGLSLFLAFHLGAIGVAWGTLLPALVVEAILIPAYTCSLIGLSLFRYWREALLRPLLACPPMLAWLLWVNHEGWVRGWLSLAASVAPALLLYAGVAWWLALDDNDQRLAAGYLQRGMRQLGWTQSG